MTNDYVLAGAIFLALTLMVAGRLWYLFPRIGTRRGFRTQANRQAQDEHLAELLQYANEERRKGSR